VKALIILIPTTTEIKQQFYFSSNWKWEKKYTVETKGHLQTMFIGHNFGQAIFRFFVKYSWVCLYTMCFSQWWRYRLWSLESQVRRSKLKLLCSDFSFGQPFWRSTVSYYSTAYDDDDDDDDDDDTDKDNSVRSFIKLLANRYSPLLTSSYNSYTVKK
jgi:hypothetical protein